MNENFVGQDSKNILDQMWTQFESTGKISDYLNYKAFQNHNGLSSAGQPAGSSGADGLKNGG